MDLSLFPVALAQASAAKVPSVWETLLMPVGLMFIMYLFILRPQQKKLKDHRNLLSELKVGDEVVTNGGIIGRIKTISDDFVSMEVASSTAIKVMKQSISHLTKPKG